MRVFLIALLSSFLVACSTTQPREEPPVEHQLVAKKIPSELLEIPSYPSAPDLTGTQKDVAVWIIENEKRVKQLEEQLKKIKTYNE